MKETFYFSHDYNARTDVKIKRLLSKHGFQGYGLYWAIIEDLYNNANALPLHCESIAFDLRTDENIIHSIIHDFELFVFDGEVFGSLSVQRRIDERDSKSKKARENAFKRWDKCKGNAKAMQPHSEGNAIKESIVKEIKDIKERKEEFKTLVLSHPTYSDIHEAFIRYWTEPNQKGNKMKFELEKTWDTLGRLATWRSRQKQFTNKEVKIKSTFDIPDEYRAG